MPFPINHIEVFDNRGNVNESADGISWGNNAAWHCVICQQHLGGNTLDSRPLIGCINPDCNAVYEIFAEKKGGTPVNIVLTTP